MNERKVDFAVKRTRKLAPLENAMQLLFFLWRAFAQVRWKFINGEVWVCEGTRCIMPAICNYLFVG